ncbi:alpha/beta fold hydrolase [Dokdonia sp.]|uniref:alpha/beta hydrolase family protein n=1 Tax=Dokdonia sp. TaxID=2024995 RepID=UPI0032645369
MIKKVFLSICLLCTFSIIVAQDSIPELVPTEVLLKKNNRHTFSISPDGKFFAQVIEDDFTSDIIIVDIDEYKLHKEIPMGSTSIDNIIWLTSKRIMYESSGEILAMDTDGNNSIKLVNRLADKLTKDSYKQYKNYRYNTVASLLPGEENEILIETYDYNLHASLKKVNIFTGEKITVLEGKKHKANKWIVDSYGNPRFALKYEDKEITQFEYNSEQNELSPFVVYMDGTEFSLTIDGESYLDQSVLFEGFGYDPNIVYLTSNHKSDKRRLISYNLKNKSVEEVLVEDAICDVKDPHGIDVKFIFDYPKGELAGIKYEGLTPQYKWFSSLYGEVYTKLNTDYNGYINDIIDVDSKNNRFLIHQWSDNNAGNIGIYDASDGSYAVMFHFNDELNKYKLSKTKSIVINARDDEKIACYLNLPLQKEASEKLIPLVVIPHGGPWSRDYWEFDDFSQYFASRGYATLRVNFRGSTGFGKSHLLAGISSIDDIMINDIADSTKAIIEKYGIDPQNVFLFGHSYGGYATYMSLLKYPDIFAAGVAVSAPTDIKNWMKVQKKEKNYFSYEFWNKALGYNKGKYLEKISPINYTKDFEKPILIFHGKYDKIIPVEQARKMAKLLKENKKNVKLEVMRFEGHTIRDTNGLGYILDTSNKFFEKH